MEKEIRALLFKLVNCRGIGNLGRLKILSFILENESIEIKKEEMLRIGQVKRYESLFLESWNALSENPEKLQEFQAEHQFLTILDERFPPLLKEIYNCPAVLFYQGNIELLKHKSIAFVGAREASSYGVKIVREFVPAISGAGWVIVSGLAKGIDSRSHEAAIKSQGQTIGVVGTGLDICYPKENTYLHRLIAKEHLLISEHPNGTPPRKHHFPMRNRIIAGLCQATCLIEARRNSGSLITAQSALEYGREVFVVPGNIFLPHSEGCHTLIYEGAKAIFSPQNIIEELNFFR
ncbi:DNA-processing protein DprA [Enterococcus sp. BWT-B8]|uniref:DNA-processing protein DprA n=1 Tax=unclassified Enterococcus TaxID=2608891 RepID=UPI001E5F72D8|nr:MULTISPECIES: DNA-processing protein DprA [unclassified Enterococcus]MCB5950698.1 DNA-processing protein DprA [Enterococcus sp. BWT-B8]MCB5955933.1 DNA-processing protein DprA [Enterococcus sp. CWB-B31]